jgi:hypothetical protein
MIEHIFSVLCSGVSIDTETNALSLFKVLEQLTVYTEGDQPLQLPIHFELLSLWTRRLAEEPCRGKARVTFISPSDNRKLVELVVDLRQSVNHRTRIMSDKLELTGPGKYLFTIELQQENDQAWEKVATLPLLVSYQTPPTQPIR